MEALERNKIRNYWNRSETYEALKIYIDPDTDGIREALVRMPGCGYIKADTEMFQNDMTSIRGKDDMSYVLRILAVWMNIWE